MPPHVVSFVHPLNCILDGDLIEGWKQGNSLSSRSSVLVLRFDEEAPLEERHFFERCHEAEDRAARGERVALYPALDKITIQNAIQWMNKTYDVNSQLEATLGNMSREAANHGILYFISFTKTVRARLDELGIDVHVLNYAEAESKITEYFTRN